MTCKDCIHYEVCGTLTNPCFPDEANKSEILCNNFKNKADYVEVVRCKDCKNAMTHAILPEKLCLVHRVSVSEGYFCASGERRDT